ncbi:MAG: respiratory nitrate reductase subunit gamma, partial [Ignavibacteriaceae bacterium]|nr:respiratory nitrate reductase subunit gamma [Ignavibacteriaceae bacterium]
MIIIYLLTYFAILLFIVMVISKIFKYANTPVHVRWELYPVAHEPKRNKYGGSHYEEEEFWKHKAKKNHLAELWAMFEEIVFLKGVYLHNRKLWYFSFPFHLGLYLITTTFLLIVLSVILNLFSIINISDIQNTADYIFHYITVLFVYAGLILTFVGCIGLLFQRATDKKFKFYNTPMDYINLLFILVLVISISITLIFSNSSLILSKEFVKNLITFNWVEINNGLFILNIILISMFLLYFPITRMMHLFAKYFTYHDVRWED